MIFTVIQERGWQAVRIRYLLAAVIALVLTGCEQKPRETIPTMAPPPEYTTTTNTYTGTTVDFIYMSTTGTTSFRNYDMIDMPEFPDLNGFELDMPDGMNGADPFGEDFQALFRDQFPDMDLPDMNGIFEDDPREQLSGAETTVGTGRDENGTISVSRADMPADEMTVTAINRLDLPDMNIGAGDMYMPDMPPVPAETVTVSAISPEPLPDDFTMDTMPEFNIAELMPDMFADW